MRRYIAEGLSRYIKDKHYPWHMPGHKRKKPDKKYDTDNMLEAIMQFDVTEVTGTDDLHHPEEMIKKSMDELTNVYGTYKSFYLVNGSTCGIMTAITASYHMTDMKCTNIIIAHNCHKSVYNTVNLLGLKSIYIDVDKISDDIYGSVNPSEVEKLCAQNEKICAVVITSPTYEGIISDVAAISAVTKKYGIPLIVDEAHGAHLPFIDELPSSAIHEGADMVIQSLHKTLPAMTQTAILHLTDKCFEESIKKYLSVYMSSSPSYPMLCSMEYAIAWTAEGNHQNYIKSLMEFRKKCTEFKNIKLLDNNDNKKIYDYDSTRIVFCITEEDNHNNISGKMLADILEQESSVVSEMSGMRHIVLISSVYDDKEDFQVLYDALKKADLRISEKKEKNIYTGDDKKGEMVIGEIDRLVGKKSEGDIYIYPPGIPIVAAGAVVDDEAVKLLKEYAAEGRKIYGL